jgi:tetratricopeptide (TPR) repeat protein
MPIQDDYYDHPIKKFQNFVDKTLGKEMSESMEKRHADRFLESIDQAQSGKYAEAAISFITCSATTLIESNKQYCENFAKAALNANNKYEDALSNAALEYKAKKAAKAIWDKSNDDLVVYLKFLGICFSERESYGEAIQYFDRALGIDPNNANAYLCRSNAKGELGNAKSDSSLIDEAIVDAHSAAGIFLAQNDHTNFTRMENLINNYKIIKNIINGVKAPDFDSSKKNFTKKKIDIDSETALLRTGAIIIFVMRLGIIKRYEWRLTVLWWYYQQVIPRIDGKSRALFNSVEEISAFIKAIEVHNGGKFPIIDNFWFSFLGRLTIWSLIVFVIVKIIGFFIK